jgi:hypothetical protein
MMKNPTKEWFNHAISLRRFPGVDVEKKQEAVNKGRFDRVEKSFWRLPVYLPLRWDLPAAAPIAPIAATTSNRLDYDLLIVGAITDTPNRQIRFKNSNSEINPSYVGRNISVNLTLGDIAGTTTRFSNDAQVGIFYYTSPFVLYKDQQITIELFKEATATTEVSNLVFIGYRIFNEKQTFAKAEDAEIKEIKQFIALREVPRQIFLKSDVVFDGNGLASDVRTPDTDEPLIIRGVKTTLRHSAIQSCKLQNGLEFNVGDVPSWALFCEPNGHDNYHYFKEPLYLPRKTALQMDIKNTIDSVYVDGNGSITWLCETV